MYYWNAFLVEFNDQKRVSFPMESGSQDKQKYSANFEISDFL